MAGLLAWIAASGPPLSAVLHTAGIVRDVAVADTGTAELAALLAPKAAGAAYLDELTADLDLDAFVLFSSIAATWGSGHQAAYAAANAFLDALAENRRSRGLAATSVAWGPWGGGGMDDANGAADWPQSLAAADSGRACGCSTRPRAPGPGARRTTRPPRGRRHGLGAVRRLVHHPPAQPADRRPA